MLAEEHLAALSEMLSHLLLQRFLVLRTAVDPQGVLRAGRRHLGLPGCIDQAVWRVGLVEVGPVGDLVVMETVIIDRAEKGHTLLPRELSQRLELRQDRLGPLDVQLAVGDNEVVLGVDVPEDRSSHGRAGFYQENARRACG